MSMIRRVFPLLLLVGCVKGADLEVAEEIPPSLDEFDVAPQGWCGNCADIQIDWTVGSAASTLPAVTVEVVFAAKTVASFSGLTGSQTQQVCHNGPQGEKGRVRLLVAGTSIDESRDLQQTQDGEVKPIVFAPDCSQGANTWKDQSFTAHLFPPSVGVARIENKSYWDKNNSGVADPNESLAIELKHPPTIGTLALQKNGGQTTDPKQVLLQGKWSATSNWDSKWVRCPTEDLPGGDDVAPPLQIDATIRCDTKP